jgi:Cdc6-like AAA superfamily ATPase
VKKELADKIEQMMSIFDNRQRRAVSAILDDCIEDDGFVFPVVDGPPGTGKTTIGTTALAKYLEENPKGQVLYMCYTHFAADQAKNTLEKKFDFPPHAALRLTPNPLEKNWDRGVIGCRSDLSDLSSNDLRKMKVAPILFCTLYGSRRAREARRAGCRVIVDEFSQVDPAIFFMAISRIRWINPKGYSLLGDPLQLPVVTTQPVLRPNIGQFIRMRKPYTPHELVVQHRMHKDICSGINSMRRKALFTYEIKSGDIAKDRGMEGLGYKWRKSEVDSKYRDILDPEYPLVIVNTDSLDGMEEESEGGSKKFVDEAKLATRLAEYARRSYVKEDGKPLEQVILSPYNAQVAEIRAMLREPLKRQCSTVYKSQGREYPLVIVSFVRKNPHGIIGFLDDIQLRAQTYVACSRAQGKLIVLLSRETFVGKGHLIFEALYNTKEAYKEDAPK